MGKTPNRFGSETGARRFPDAFREADLLLNDLVDKGRAAGLAIQVSFKGNPLFTAGYGKADLKRGRKVRPESTVFRIASISKPVTATALARLVEEGVLGLEEDIRTHVPEFPEKHGKVTLRHLASHTAGIRGYRGKEYALNRPLSIADSLEVFVEDPLLFPPGDGYHYNSFDFVLLSLAMERACGQPFHELVAERVLRPLSMQSTYMEIPGKPVPGQSCFYSRYGTGFRRAAPVDTRYKLAAGGYLSTVGDVCRLGSAYLQGAIAAPGTLRPFLTSCIVGGKPTWYGLGWQVSEDKRGRPYYGHVGNTVGAYSNFFVYPKEELVFCILANCPLPLVQPVFDQVVDTVLGSLPAS